METVIQAGKTVLSSEKKLWEGVTVHEKILPPMQTGTQAVSGHLLMINIGQPGFGEYRSGSDKWQCKFYQTGSISIVPDGYVNDARWDVEANVIYMTIDPALLQRIMDTDQIALSECRGVSDAIIRRVMCSLHNELQSNDYASKLQGESLAITLATHIVMAHSRSKNKSYAPQGKLSSTQLLTIIDYTLAHIDQPIGLADLSQLANISLFHFARLFKNTLGISPHQYLLQLKIEKAIQLIQQKQHSFTEVAYLMGFSDQAHFTNAFKKVKGVAPTQFVKY